MPEPRIFKIDPESDSDIALLEPTVAARKDAATEDPTDINVEGVGAHLAELMLTQGFHPVIVFGSAGSGKTSLLASLIAAARTEPNWQCGVDMTGPVMSEESDYGRFLHAQAEQFMGRTVQDFIEGRAAPKTNVRLPFFVPVEFRPNGKSPVKLAFLESNGEWYQPDRTSNRFFPTLKPEIESFIRNFQSGISFLHIVPYTQAAVAVYGVDKSADLENMRDASLAIAGALSAYESVRADKTKDSHLMLVTKWDAHRVPEHSIRDILLDTSADVDAFVKQRYPQALATYKGLTLSPSQLGLSTYCSGLISGSNVLTLKSDNELRPLVLSFQKGLWRWLYGNALRMANEPKRDPFPNDKYGSGIMAALWRWLDRWFD